MSYPEGITPAPLSTEELVARMNARIDAEVDGPQARQRRDYSQGMNILMKYKGISAVTVYSMNWDGHKAPPAAIPPIMDRGKGNNRLFVIWSGQASPQDLAAVFINSPQVAGEGGVVDMGFNELQFVTRNKYCYVTVLPRPLGLGQLTCQPR
jgi:hypothetical protein